MSLCHCPPDYSGLLPPRPAYSPILDNSTMVWVYEMVATSPALWLLQLLLITVCLLPDVLIEVARTHGRGLDKFCDRARVALGFPTSAVSTLPAFTRRPVGSCRGRTLRSGRQSPQPPQPASSCDLPPYSEMGSSESTSHAVGAVRVSEGSRSPMSKSVSGMSPRVAIDSIRRPRVRVTDVST